jgi:hypothetical protein
MVSSPNPFRTLRFVSLDQVQENFLFSPQFWEPDPDAVEPIGRNRETFPIKAIGRIDENHRALWSNVNGYVVGRDLGLMNWRR